MERKDLKWDEGKLKFDLILPGFEELMATILTKGMDNHPPIEGKPSWQHLERIDLERALYRHVNKYKAGNRIDKHMGTHEAGHISVNAMFLWWFDQQEKK